jgi:hypothetical protein
MNIRRLAWVSVALLFGWTGAGATSITGDWTGTFQDILNGSGLNNGTLDLQILTETPDGTGFDLTAAANFTCTNTPDPSCGSQGYVPLTGTFDGATSLILNSVVGPTGSLELAGNLLVGNAEITGNYWFFAVQTDPKLKPAVQVYGSWDVVSTQVPEPGTLALLSLGVAGLGVMRRRSTR